MVRFSLGWLNILQKLRKASPSGRDVLALGWLSILQKPLSFRIKVLIYAASVAIGVIIILFGYSSFCLKQGVIMFSPLSFVRFFSRYAAHPYIGFAIIASLAMPSVVIHFENWRKRLIDNALPRLLEDLAESQETGMTLLQSLEESSRRKYGPITDELKKLTAELSWGVEFEKAFTAFSERIGTELSVRTTTLVLEATTLGGDLKSTFNSTAEFVRQMIELRDERESQLRPYMMVIYVSTLIFVLIVIILYHSFFLPMAKEPSRFLKIPMSLEGYKALLFDLSLIEGIFGGLTAGKISEGLTFNGLKHSVVLGGAASAILTILF